MRDFKRTKGEADVVILWAILFILPFGAWLTHVVTCLSDERWGFLIAGAIFFPVAIVHGFGIWFGVW